MHEPGRQQPREEEPNFSLGRHHQTDAREGKREKTDTRTMLRCNQWSPEPDPVGPRLSQSRVSRLVTVKESRSRPPRRDRQCRIPWPWAMARLPNAHAHTGQREVGCEAGWSWGQLLGRGREERRQKKAAKEDIGRCCMMLPEPSQGHREPSFKGGLARPRKADL